MQVCALIMAGGHGTRFWPWSSELLPKQFLPIADPDRSLLRQTYERIAPLVDQQRVLVLTNKEYHALVRTQLPEVAPDNIIGEPMLRDTSAAIALGASIAARRWPDAVQIVLPADHEIAPDARFREVLGYAARCANDDGLLYTIGINPSRPSAAYGYLHRGEALDSERGFRRAQVAAFVEKPDEATARKYVRSGEYYWNAGIFVWRADAVQQGLARRLPEHARLVPEAVSHEGELDYEQRLHDVFLKLPKISIDFGMMQAEGEAGNVRCVVGDFRWSDLGGWSAFAEKLEPDELGNRVFGHCYTFHDGKWQERWQPREVRKGDKDEDLSLGEVLAMDSRDNLVFNSRRGHRIALYRVNDLAVIHTHRATLITPRAMAEAIKPLINNLPDEVHRGGPVTPEKVNKPWGWELWWGWTDDFAGKTLFLQQGKRFSLQYHVVKEEVIYVHQGRVKLETAPRGEPLQTLELKPGDAIHVEPGRLHRIEALEDSLLFESSLPFLWDVVRLADDFGREGTRAAEVGGAAGPS